MSHSPALLVIANGFEGLMLVPLIVGVVEYINSRVDKKLKATAQTALTLFSVVIARTVGNIGGGALIDVFNAAGLNGMRMTFWVLVPISLIAAIAIGIPLLAMQRKSREDKN
jgi:MFS family permease